MTPIAPHIEAYLRDHLGQQRGASPHTCESYAHSFQRLFEFAAKRLKLSPSALTVEHVDASLIASFLEHLEDGRSDRHAPQQSLQEARAISDLTGD